MLVRGQCGWLISRCQRCTNQARICAGSAVASVHSNAWVAHRPCGPRMSTQRSGTGGRPVWYHTAVSDATATARAPAPYQWAMVMLVQAVSGSARRAARVGNRAPLRRGRPCWRGRRGGAGASRAASRRRRVMTVTGRRREAHAARKASAASPLSATATMARSGHQRRTTRSNWRAQSGNVPRPVRADRAADEQRGGGDEQRDDAPRGGPTRPLRHGDPPRRLRQGRPCREMPLTRV